MAAIANEVKTGINRFSEIEKKGALLALLCNIEEATTKSGGTYCKCTFSDGDMQITAKLWNSSEDEVVEKTPICTVVWVELDKQEYNGQASWVCKGLRPGPADADPTNFIISAPYKPEVMYQNILKIVFDECPDSMEVDEDGNRHPKPGTLTSLLYILYEKNKEKLVYWSAAKAVHHNCYGGLLFHVLRMIVSARYATRTYAFLNRELLLVGTALHDIGKLVELETDKLGVADYTVDGNLYGHLMIGVEMIDREVWSNPDLYDEEQIRCLKHMIASHHGTLDFGAIKTPAIPEAIALYFIDNMDARMYICEKEYEQMNPGTINDSTNFALGARLYKPTFRADLVKEEEE